MNKSKEKKNKNRVKKSLASALALTLTGLSGCDMLPREKYELIRHPGYEIYDDDNISTSGDFFSYRNGILTMEGKDYSAKENPDRTYPLNKSILENIFEFMAKTAGVLDGTDVFTSKYDTEIPGDAFYDKEYGIDGNEIVITDDRIYVEPRTKEPFTIKADMHGNLTASWATSILETYFQTGMHEPAHQIYNRGDRTGFDGLLEKILRNNFGIITSEKGIEPYKHITKTTEAYANFYMMLVSLKFQNELEQHIIENYKFTFKDAEGNILSENEKLTELNLDPILEYNLSYYFLHDDISTHSYGLTTNEDRTRLREKLEDLRTRVQSGELDFLFN